jgi:hypothetical protein
MKYICVKWNHSLSNEPVLLLSEIDDDRIERRKVEIFVDGRIGYASSTESYGGTRLGEVAIPPLSEISNDPEFEPTEISKEDFEIAWESRKK